MTNIAQRNFSAGEISPSLWGRVDHLKYQTGMRQMRNWIAQRHGGTTYRPGTEFCGESKTSSLQCRVIPWVLDDAIATDIYVLELGDKYVRFWQNGTRVLATGILAWATATVYAAGVVVSDGGTNYICTAGHTSGAGTEPGVGGSWQSNWYALNGTILELPTPWAVADVFGIQYVQNQAVMTLVHKGYPVQELTRVSSANQQWALAAAIFAPGTTTPTNLAYSAGGVAGGPTYWAVTAVDATSGEESLAAVVSAAFVPSAGSPVTITWSLVAGVQKYFIYRSTDGATFGFVDQVGGANLASTTITTWAGSPSSIITNTQGAWVPAVGAIQISPVAAVTDKATDGQYVVSARIKVIGSTGAGFTQARAHAYYQRNTDAVKQDAGILQSTTVTGNGTVGPFGFTGTISVPDDGYTSMTIFVFAEVFGAGPGGSTFEADVDISAPFNKITWNKGATSFIDRNIAQDNTNGPPHDLKLFQTPGNYPTTVASYQQRRIFGGSASQPGFIWASRTGSRRNFTIPTPEVPGAAIIFEMDAKKAVIIRHLIDLARMAVFTATEEKIIEGRYDSGILEPDNINVRSHSYNGIAANIRPIVIDTVAIYLQARGNQVRLLKYDSEGVSQSTDLSLYASHLFRRRQILDWTFCYTPDHVAWAVRNDGILIAMTYHQDESGQMSWGWHRHDTDGKFESVCAVPEGIEDRLYVVVNRTINGVTKRYIERLALPHVKDITDIRDAHYLDCGLLAFDGRNVDTANAATLTGGVAWATTEHLTLSTQKNSFAPGDVGTTFLLQSASTTLPDGTIQPGDRLYFVVDTYVNPTSVQGLGLKLVPTSLQGVATTDWARCAAQVTNLAHLEGKKVAILADGYVDASPNNPNFAIFTVVGGTITLPSPRSAIRVGLPYIGDLETLDIDAERTTVKATNRLITRIVMMLENSRGLFTGLATSPTADDPTNGLDELKLRDQEDFDEPTSLLSGDADMPIQSTYKSHGRFLTRQVDPLPATILMISPSFDEN